MPPAKCPRCGGPANSWTMSRFNTEEICLHCADDERTLPSYRAAEAAESAAVATGNYNFPGIGLSSADRVRLQQLRDARKFHARE